MAVTAANELGLHDLALAGATTFTVMGDDMILAASMLLVGCHPHHFAVCMLHGRRGMLMSPAAHACLDGAGLFEGKNTYGAKWTPKEEDQWRR